MRLFWRKNNKPTTMKLEDCVNYYKENPQYRYAVVVGKDRLPRSICETMEGAKEDYKTHWVSGGELPIEIVDLAFCEMEGKYAAKRL